MNMNQLIEQVQHIQFSTLDAGVGFWREHGGWLFVGEGESCVVWFSSAWTPSAILTSQVLAGVNGVLSPTAEQLESLRGMPNPYEVGTKEHKHFATHYPFAMRQSAQCLVERYLRLRTLQCNLQQSGSATATKPAFEASLEAEMLIKVYEHRFDRSIHDHVISLLEQQIAA